MNNTNNKTNNKTRTTSENRNVRRGGYLSIKQLSLFGRLLLWLFSNTEDKVHSYRMISRLMTTARLNGTIFLVQYLKESHRLTMKCLASQPEKCTTFPRVGTRRGLPLIIPGPLRLKIERRDVPVVQLVLSILTVYRVLRIPPVLKLNTITDVFSGNSRTLPEFEIRQVLREWSAHQKWRIFDDAKIIPSVTSGPQGCTAVLLTPLDA
jgi:hypothetical protein